MTNVALNQMLNMVGNAAGALGEGLKSVNNLFSELRKKSADDQSNSDKNENEESSLVDTIETSKLGPVLSMIGGREALLPIKEPVINKLKIIIKEKIESIFEHKDEANFTSNIRDGIQKALNNKLDELNAIDIKIIIENMIRKHLGWLIVWGGFFGGLFGLIFSAVAFLI